MHLICPTCRQWHVHLFWSEFGLTWIADLRAWLLIYMCRKHYFHYSGIHAVDMNNSSHKHVVFESPDRLASFAITRSQSSGTYADCSTMLKHTFDLYLGVYTQTAHSRANTGVVYFRFGLLLNVESTTSYPLAPGTHQKGRVQRFMLSLLNDTGSVGFTNLSEIRCASRIRTCELQIVSRALWPLFQENI